MPHEVDSWRNWLLWPLRKIFGRTSKPSLFQVIDNSSDDSVTLPRHILMQRAMPFERRIDYQMMSLKKDGSKRTRDEAEAEIQAEDQEFAEALERGEVSPGAVYALLGTVLYNQIALERYEEYSMTEGVHVRVLINGQIREVRIPPQRQKISPEESMRRLMIFIEKQKQTPEPTVGGRPHLQLAE